MAIEHTEGPSVKGFLRYDEPGDRARLHFEAVRSKCPELANTVELIRGRTIKLQQNFNNDAEEALVSFNKMTVLTIGVAVAAVIIGTITSFFNGAHTTAAISIGVGVLAAVIGAGTQALGWHKRYGAMFSARWEMEGLRSWIDQEVLELAMRVDESGALSDQDRARLTDSTKLWVDSLNRTMSSFGKAYGAAIEPVEIPKAVSKTES